MHRALVLLAAAACLRGGVIQGVVVEHASGRPLSRTLVRLEPVPQSGSGKTPPHTTRAGRSGHFVFAGIAPGIYLLSAQREGYFRVEYGQRLPIGHGTPITVAEESDLFAELRLRHKGAVTGRVLDENGVGQEGVPVVAYRARLPLRAAGSAVSDDRGVYRVHGLDPGKYWVRSAAHTLEDGSGWLPTFGPQAREVRDARIHPVVVDADTPDADLIPEPGALFHLGGMIQCEAEVPVTVTLSSETGRRRVQAACRNMYRFDGLAPGVYEVFAKMQDGSGAGFTEMALDRDSDTGNVQLMQPPKVDIEVRRAGARTVGGVPCKLLGRRQDLSETESEREITGLLTTLDPGHWEFRAIPPSGQYVESITNPYSAPRRPWKAERAPDWFEVFIEPRRPARVTIALSDKAGQIKGRVSVEGKAVPGAPVFLWPVAESARRSLRGAVETLADADGQFHFDSLPPGEYRALASFDVNEIDEELVEMSHALAVRAEAMQTATVELGVWVAPW